MRHQRPQMIHPIERNLARVLMQLRQTNFGQIPVTAQNVLSDDDFDYFNDFEEEYENSIRQKISLEEWMSDIETEKLDTHAIDNLILDFLIKSGNNGAVQAFSEESGLSIENKLETHVSYLCDEITSHLKEGDVVKVVDRLRQIDPLMLSKNKILWTKIMGFKLVSNPIDLSLFIKKDLVHILAECDTLEDRETIITEFEDIMHGIFVEGQLYYTIGDVMKEISAILMKLYSIKPNSNIEEMLHVTYGVQKAARSLYEAPKLTEKNLIKGANLITE